MSSSDAIAASTAAAAAVDPPAAIAVSSPATDAAEQKPTTPEENKRQQQPHIHVMFIGGGPTPDAEDDAAAKRKQVRDEIRQCQTLLTREVEVIGKFVTLHAGVMMAAKSYNASVKENVEDMLQRALANDTFVQQLIGRQLEALVQPYEKPATTSSSTAAAPP